MKFMCGHCSARIILKAGTNRTLRSSHRLIPFCTERAMLLMQTASRFLRLTLLQWINSDLPLDSNRLQRVLLTSLPSYILLKGAAILLRSTLYYPAFSTVRTFRNSFVPTPTPALPRPAGLIRPQWMISWDGESSAPCHVQKRPDSSTQVSQSQRAILSCYDLSWTAQG